jgi:F-type H+-transporting ATPase subunit epsilon
MKFNVLTQEGKTYTDECQYVVIKNRDGELAILKDHIPIIVYVSEGYVKFVDQQNVNFLVVEQGVVEFKDNVLTVLALEAQMGKTFDQAKNAFDTSKNEKLQLTKKENVDFSKQERELKENITKGRAGNL